MMETKLRRVATQAGADFYGQPIGSVIVRDVLPVGRTNIPKIDALVDKFLGEKLSDWTGDNGPTIREFFSVPENAHGNCQFVTEQFVEFAKKKGFDAYSNDVYLEEIGYRKPRGRAAGYVLDAEGNEVLGFYPEHTVAVIYLPGRTWPVALDFSATQYGYNELPKVIDGDPAPAKKPRAPKMKAVALITREQLSNPDTPRTRAISRSEFMRLARKGQQRLAGFQRNSSTPTALTEDWESTKQRAWDSVQEDWGGITLDTHSGIEVPDHADQFALTVKTPGQASVSIPIEGLNREDFDSAMDEARSRFTAQFAREQHHLGVFRDADTGNIDIDPVLVVDSLDDVESIGAYTHAVGGAFRFSDELGYWPPYVDESKGAGNEVKGIRAVAHSGKEGRSAVSRIHALQAGQGTEVKARVRTQEGAERFDQPIGSVIVRDVDVLPWPRLKSIGSLAEEAAVVNPHWREGDEYQNNCTSCTAAFEMRMRGFDVEAIPMKRRQQNDFYGVWGTQVVFKQQKIWRGFHYQPRHARHKPELSEAERYLADMPEGARGAISVGWWKTGGRHMFNWVKQNGRVRYVDAQMGKPIPLSDFIKKVSDYVQIARLDDMEATPLLDLVLKTRGT
jgi:hypothetical protein